MTDTTCVGKIINTHGIKGFLKIEPYTDNNDRFSDLEYLLIGEDLERFTIENVFYKGRFVFIKFHEFDNINQVLKFKEKFVYIHDEDRVKLPSGTYFISDLVECKVYTLDENHVGILESVIENPVNDIYVIKNNGKEFLIPARKEFIKSIDINNKIIKIDPIEGMID